MTQRLRFVLLLLVAIVIGLTTAAGCLERPVARIEPVRHPVFVDQLQLSSVDKIDLLFMIDNSASMADKQKLLELAVPDLVDRLVNPRCVVKDDSGNITSQGPRPESPQEPCTVGEREFTPLEDIHVGVITSSLGGHGADLCVPSDTNATLDDAGRLITRTESGSPAATYRDLGFLAWDPQAEKSPPGFADATALSNAFSSIVVGAGEEGCGFEASLESWYRFLIDPEPYATLERVPCSAEDTTNGCIEPTGLDQALLSQRREFLRPDSLVAIVMLTDENDCSVIDGSRYYLALESRGGTFRLPRATDECESNPDDPCCRSCGAPTPDGCPEASSYAACTTNEGLHAGNADTINLRCFDQKRRFGLDFLHPVSRYVRGLRDDQVPNRRGELVPNPLYTNRETGTRSTRPTDNVVLAGIVGVPWQLIANDSESSDNRLVYQTGEELREGNVWEAMIGTCPGTEVDGECSETRVSPSEPLMRESIEPRQGVGPTGAAIEPPSASAGANPINGHEWNILDRNDLQYACIFPRVEALPGRDCESSNQTLNPLCQDATTGAYGDTQFLAKAFPGTRQLEVLKGLGDDAIVASICARNIDQPDDDDFGYRPAISAIVDRLKQSIVGRCLPRELEVQPNGAVPCVVVEAAPTGSASCDCGARAARSVASEEAVAAVQRDFERRGRCGGSTGSNCDADFCFCEVLPAGGSRGPSGITIDQGVYSTCQNRADPPDGVDGFCYVDPVRTSAPSTPERDAQNRLVSNCEPTERRILRFVGGGRAPADTTTFLACIGTSDN